MTQQTRQDQTGSNGSVAEAEPSISELRHLRETVWRLQCENTRLRAAVEEFEQLFEESEGVYGFRERDGRAEWQWLTENRLPVLASLID